MSVSASLISGSEVSVASKNSEQSYDHLLDSLYAGNAVDEFDNKLWVPWYKTSSSCNIGDLQNGGNCNVDSVDFEHNCMVTDEFSQVGILVAMGNSEARMDKYYNTVLAIKSNNGDIPAWRVYRNGNSIEQCKQGVNGNCDTASDATARIIISLYAASKNTQFSQTARSKYLAHANKLSSDFYDFEVVHECKNSNLGYGQICNWLAAGSEAKKGGLGSHDFTYTGYFGDAVIAMLNACAITQDQKYCVAAKDFTLNYLQASNWNGDTFSAPPGRSFNWIDIDTVPKAQCTGNCQDNNEWDGFDAPRALGICAAQYYADKMNYQMPGLKEYCKQWGDKYMTAPDKAVIQYFPDGSTSKQAQHGYFAQGLQSLFQLGYNLALYKSSLNSAISHFSPSTSTWDQASCFGVYTSALAVRSLGIGIGRGDISEGVSSLPLPQVPSTGTPPGTVTPPPVLQQPTQTPATPPQQSDIASLSASCIASSTPCPVKSDKTEGQCRTVVFSTAQGDLQLMACKKDGNNIEVYRQMYPQISFKACIGDGCVDEYGGFAKFVMQPSQTPAAATPSIPTQPPVTTPTNQEPSQPAAPIPSNTDLSSVAITCQNSALCTSQQDVTSGDCRMALTQTDNGFVKWMACKKGANDVELYRQSWPGGDFKVCLGSACIDQSSGFAKFSMVQSSENINEPTGNTQTTPENPTVADSTTPPTNTNENTGGSSGGSGSGGSGSAVTPSGVASLNVDLSVQGNKISDTIENSGCRIVEFASTFGSNKARICPKENNFYEMYLLTPPIQAVMCIGSSCVGSNSGFARFSV